MTLSRLKDGLLQIPALSTQRMAISLVTAVIADGLQLLTQGIPFAPQGIDVVAAVIVSRAIGFHPLLLPTFVIELFPVVDALPTWTGCVLAVLVMRRSGTHQSGSPVPTVSKQDRQE